MNWLEIRRKELGISQESLADMLGVGRSSISNWENNKFHPPLDDPKFRRMLANALEMAIPDLLLVAGYEVDKEHSRKAMRAADIVDRLPPDYQDLALRLLEQLLPARTG